MLRAIKSLVSFKRRVDSELADVVRRLRKLERCLGLDQASLRVDEDVEKVPGLLTIFTEPLLSPPVYPWMKPGVIFDGRPCFFNGKLHVYFCAQEFYDPRSDMVIGCAVGDCDAQNLELLPEALSVVERPVLFPTVEAAGIDIPAFCADHERVYCVYFDNYGSARTSDCRACDLVVADSDDGLHFRKSRMVQPFAIYPFARMGLPWLEVDNGEVMLYVRAGDADRKLHYVSRCGIDLCRKRLTGPWQHLAVPRRTINISTVTVGGRVFIFHGLSVAGGFYVHVASADTFKSLGDFMLIDEEHNPWGCDVRKSCTSPCKIGDTLLLAYLSDMRVGYAVLSCRDLERV